MKRSLPAILLVILLSNAWAVATTDAPASQSRPNILLIVVDDLGYGELGCRGNEQIPTPNIDSIAKAGVRFTQGYVTASFCSPSRAGLLTGRYQTRFGHELNAVGAQNLRPEIGLPESQKTLADRLKAIGYTTALIGKWHLGGTVAYHPQKRGFDEFFGFLHEGHSFAPPYFPGLVSHLRVKEPPYDQDNPLLRGDQPVEEPSNLTTAFAREAVAFINRNRNRPFFLYLPFNAVHSPMQASPAYFDRFRHIDDLHRRVFAAMLGELDDAVGTVLGKLRDLNLEERTLVIFISDNGGPVAELTSQNTPLRGGKGQLYEGGIRVPFMMQWKGTLPANKVYEPPVISLDATATALAAAGALAPADADGVNLIPFITAGKSNPPHDVLYWRMGTKAAIRKGKMKLVRHPPRGGGSRFELYDLGKDVAETTDLAMDMPEAASALQREWERLDATMVPPAWLPSRQGAERPKAATER